MKRKFSTQLDSVSNKVWLNCQSPPQKHRIFLITLLVVMCFKSNHFCIVFLVLSFGSRCISNSYGFQKLIYSFFASKDQIFSSTSSVTEELMIIKEVQLARVNELQQMPQHLNWHSRVSFAASKRFRYHNRWQSLKIKILLLEKRNFRKSDINLPTWIQQRPVLLLRKWKY